MRKLHEIMSHVVVSASSTESIDEARAKMRQFRAHQLLVMDGHRPVGVVAKRDLPRAHAPADHEPGSVRARMKPVVVAPGSVTVAEAERLVEGREVFGVAVTLQEAVVGLVPIETLHEACAIDERFSP